MDKWSPQAAMNAYLHTLQLCQSNEYGKTRTVEPKCMELVSALAAGKRAKLMLEITTQETITPLTIALAVAAKHTGGRFICMNINQQNKKPNSKNNLIIQDLQGVIEFEFVHNSTLQLVNELKNVDLLVIDGRLEDQMIKLVKNVDFNGNGCNIVAHNMHCYRRNNLVSFGEVLNGKKKGVECKTMPIGDGIELTRIGCMSKTRRFRRFHVAFENS